MGQLRDSNGFLWDGFWMVNRFLRYGYSMVFRIFTGQLQRWLCCRMVGRRIPDEDKARDTYGLSWIPTVEEVTWMNAWVGCG